jgi:hypothetical protein
MVGLNQFYGWDGLRYIVGVIFIQGAELQVLLNTFFFLWRRLFAVGVYPLAAL